MDKTKFTGHLAAIVTVLLWGTTFISTKVLLVGLTPIQILVYRFILGLLVLFILHPHILKWTGTKNELFFAGAGITGICLYYLLENIALTMELASNVSIIVSTAPFFTAILTSLVVKPKTKLSKGFFIGFVVAMAGIIILCNGGGDITLNLQGDILALGASVVWAVYSQFIREINVLGLNNIAATRRVFEYGIIFMIPASAMFGFEWNLAPFADPIYILNIVFLGIGASAICFAAWNYSLKAIGTVRASIYIYAVPAITVIAAAMILSEPVTIYTIVGILLTAAGLVISGYEKK